MALFTKESQRSVTPASNQQSAPFFAPAVQLQSAGKAVTGSKAKAADQLTKAPPTLYDILNEGKIKSPTFASLMATNKIMRGNYKDIIVFETSTETTNKGIIHLTPGNDLQYLIIQLAHELTNRAHLKDILKVSEQVEKGLITPAQYAEKLARIEIYGEINQIKVAAEIGYRYSGKEFLGLNKLIDDYSKNKSINLSKRVIASTQHLARYEAQGKILREEYLRRSSSQQKK